MKTKITVLIILFLLLFTLVSMLPTSATYAQYKYNSPSIVCGNSACEHISFKIKIGEEKSVEIAGKTYTFKLVNIENIPREIPITSQTGEQIGSVKEYGHKVYLSINGGSTLVAQDAIKELGVSFQYHVDTPNLGQPSDTVVIQNYEDVFCAAPDCAFKVELNVLKKWNLVPLYFFSPSTDANYIESALKQGTCELQDFTAIYGYNPLKKEYVKLYNYGESISQLSNSLSAFRSIGEAQHKEYQIGTASTIDPEISTTLIGTWFNSVWVFSKNECKLAAELPKILEEFLLVVAREAEQTGKRFAVGLNLFVGGKDIEGKSLDEIKGSCAIEKAYTFDASSQSWKQLTTGVGPSTNFVVKVSNKCMLGLPEIAPPEIPT